MQGEERAFQSAGDVSPIRKGMSRDLRHSVDEREGKIRIPEDRDVTATSVK